MQTQTKVSERKLLSLAGLGWLFDAMDVGILSFITAALYVEWQLSPDQMKWIGSINSLGMALGAVIFGLLADKIGRKKVFIFTMLLFSIGSGLSALVTSFVLFLTLRFFIGMGLGGELPVASTFVSEAVAPERRGRMVVMLESFWAIGWILSAVIAYFVIPYAGWRIALLITALPALYTIYLRKKLPDSTTDSKTEKPNVIKRIRLLWSKRYQKATLMLWIVWFMVVFSYYGMFLWLPSMMILKGFSMVQSFEYVLWMTLAQLPGYFLAAWLIERVGRRWLLMIFLTGTAVSAYYFGASDSFVVLMASGMCLSFFNLGAWGILYAYTPEQYPAKVRATGAGMAAGFGRIGGMIGPFFVGSMVAGNISTQIIFCVFCMSIFVGILAIFFLGTETKQATLK